MITRIVTFLLLGSLTSAFGGEIRTASITSPSGRYTALWGEKADRNQPSMSIRDSKTGATIELDVKRTKAGEIFSTPTWSGDEKLIAFYDYTAGGAGYVLVYSAATGKKMYAIKMRQSHYGALAFSPNSEMIATSNAAYRLSDGELIECYAVPAGNYASVTDKGLYVLEVGWTKDSRTVIVRGVKGSLNAKEEGAEGFDLFARKGAAERPLL